MDETLVHLHQRLIDSVCRKVKYMLFWLIRYPCYQYDEFLQKVSALRGEISQKEFDEFASVSAGKGSSYHRTIMILLSLAYALKNLYVLYITLKELDFKDLSTNSSVMYPIDADTYMTACVHNNCTQFLRPHTGKTLDIRHYPVIPLCHPILQLFLPPTTWMGPYALIIHAMLGFIALILGVALPITQLYHPLKCETIMFLAAPVLTRDLMIEKVKNIYNTYRRSYVNYLECIEQKQMHRLSTLDNYAPITMDRRFSSKIKLQVQMERLRKSQFGMDSGRRLFDPNGKRESYRREYFVACSDQCERWNQFVIDCLPCVRRLWWNSKAQNVFVRMFAAFTSFIIFETGLILSDIIARTLKKIREYQLYVGEMVSTGCRNWIMDGDRLVHLFEPSELHVNVNWFSIGDNLLLLFLLIIVPSLTAVYYLMDCELTCWRLELQNQIYIMSEITRLQLLAKKLKQEQPDNDVRERPQHDMKERRRSLYGFDPIDEIRQSTVTSEHFEYTIRFRNLFLENHVLSLFVSKEIPYGRCDIDKTNEHRRSVLNGQIGLQQTVIDMMSEVELTSSGYIILMEKMYISFRLFMEHVRHCSDTTPPLTFVTHFLSYGLIAISVWHSNLIEKFNYEHMLIVLTSCSWSILLISLMSKFHARVSINLITSRVLLKVDVTTNQQANIKSRETERSLLNLLGLLAEVSPTDHRLGHLRLIWLKQMRMVSNEGGIVLRIFHLRVTYVNVLQVSGSDD